MLETPLARGNKLSAIDNTVPRPRFSEIHCRNRHVMEYSELTQKLVAEGGVLTDRTGAGVLHFGDPVTELAALENGTVAVPLLSFGHIRLTGRDRAKFLHNFCTNDINGLSVDKFCEAFFPDVKARILEHGWIGAHDNHHDIWMLAGNEQQLASHLSRYVITEDVNIATTSASQSTFVLLGPGAVSHATSCFEPCRELTAGVSISKTETKLLCTKWPNMDAVFVAVNANRAVDTWRLLCGGPVSRAGLQVFEHARIQSCYPLFGRDLTSQNIVPEADRNQSAVCYTKGCYLGQEPIARIDAMGHVNRKLCLLAFQNETTDRKQAGSTTSESCLATNHGGIGMAVVRIADISNGQVAVQRQHGDVQMASVLNPSHRR